MTYQELLELKNKRAEKVREGEGLLAKKDFDAHKALMGEVQKMNEEIDAAELQLAEEGRFAEGDPKMKTLHAQQQKKKAEEVHGCGEVQHSAQGPDGERRHSRRFRRRFPRSH